MSMASSQYSQAKSIVSAQITGSPKPIHEQMFSSVEVGYSDSVAAASRRLQSALSAVSTGVYSAPPGALESISSVASSRLSEALSLASAQYLSAKTAIGATPTPAAQKYLSAAHYQYYAVIGHAHERYSEFITAASSAIMPTATPFHQSLYNRAGESVEGASAVVVEGAKSAASEISTAIYGSETPSPP
jgi:hypothetical protein